MRSSLVIALVVCLSLTSCKKSELRPQPRLSPSPMNLRPGSGAVTLEMPAGATSMSFKGSLAANKERAVCSRGGPRVRVHGTRSDSRA